jgi:hypothetical protein
MKASTKSGEPLLAKEAGGAVVLAGPPGRLRGQLRVQNRGERKLVVRRPMLRAAAREPTLPEALGLRRIVVRAGQTRPVSLTLALDPRTPPGTYHGELDLEGERRDVVLHVTEAVALRIEPATVVLPSHPGARVDKKVVLINEGNVPIPIRTIGPVVLDDELAHCRALRGALADVGESMRGLDDFTAALGRRYAAIYAPLWLRVHNEPLTLAAGETAAVELAVTLPDKLDARSRYGALAPLSTSTLLFSIVPD